MSVLEVENSEENYLEELEDILKKEEITTVYQPIISFINGEVIGYEALSRGPVESSLRYPNKLFEIARKYNKTWELELLCRVKAIQNATDIQDNKFLFINVDPHIFKDEKFKKGFTKEYIENNNMSCENIIFEITEKTCIQDYKSFKNALANYTEQGFKIAIDDAGAGYSGLKTITETKPNFLKLDMEIIRDIDKDSFKQAIIEAFVKLSINTNMKLIAEGIETEEEMRTLIHLGVYAGQGFLLNKPSEEIEDISDYIKNKIIKYNRMRSRKSLENGLLYIGDIARFDKSFDITTKSMDVKNFLDSEKPMGVCIVKDDIPVGLVMKDNLDKIFAKAHGNRIIYKKSIKILMDVNPLIIDYYTAVSEVSKIVTSRGIENKYDYIIITKDEKFYGIVTVMMLLRYSTMIEDNCEKYFKNLSQLACDSIEKSIIY